MKRLEKLRNGLGRDTWASLIIVACILIVCCLWAGIRSSGFSLIHVLCLCALSVNLRWGDCRKAIWLHPAQWRLYAVFWGLLFLNYLIAGSSAIGRDVLTLWLDVAIVIWIISRVPRRFLLDLLTIWLACSTPIVVIHIMYLAGTGSQLMTPSYFRHGWHFGFYANMMLFPAIVLAIHSRQLVHRITGAVCAAFSMIYLLLDVKTAPVLAFFLGLVLLGVQGTVGAVRRAFISIFILGLVAGLAAASFDSKLLADMFKTFKTEQYWTLHNDPMKTALNAALAHPFAGLGIGNFEYRSGAYEPPGMAHQVERAHNSFLELFAETGFPGLIVLFALLASFLFRLIRQVPEQRAIQRGIKSGIVISMILAFFLGCADSGLQMPANALAVTFLFALLLADTEPNSSRHLRTNANLAPFRRFWYLPLIAVLVSVPSLISGFFMDVAQSASTRGRYRSAIEWLDRARRLDPLDDRIRVALVQNLSVLSSFKHDTSMNDRMHMQINAALRLNPGLAEMYFLRAQLADHTEKKSDRDDRISDLRRAVEIDPSNPHYSMALMHALLSLEDQTESMEIFNRFLIATSPIYHEAIAYSLVDFWSDRLRFRDVVEASLDKWPRSFSVTLCYQLRTKGLDLDALFILEKLVPELPGGESPHTIQRVIDLAFLLKQNSIAERLVHSVVASGRYRDLESYLFQARARIALAEDRSQEGIEFLRSAVRLDPANIALRIKLGQSLKKAHGAEVGIVYFRQLAQEFQSSADVHLAFAHELELAGLTLEALYEYRQANMLSQESLDRKVDELYQKLEIDSFWR